MGRFQSVVAPPPLLVVSRRCLRDSDSLRVSYEEARLSEAVGLRWEAVGDSTGVESLATAGGMRGLGGGDLSVRLRERGRRLVARIRATV